MVNGLQNYFDILIVTQCVNTDPLYWTSNLGES